MRKDVKKKMEKKEISAKEYHFLKNTEKKLKKSDFSG